MAKTSAVERNKKRERLAKQYRARRAVLKAKIYDRSLSVEERFELTIKLAQMPRNGSRTRLHSRCELTGRPRGNYRKFNLSRIVLRDLASAGQIPGMVKSSW